MTNLTFPCLPDDVSHRTLEHFPLSMVLADPRQPDCPIVFVNTAFTRATGYARDQVVGRNCRFLQGAATDAEDCRQLSEAIREGREIAIDIVNYRAGGELFLNHLLITPIRDADGELILFLGVQMERARLFDRAAQARELQVRLDEMQHRVKNHLAMILSMIRIESRSGGPERAIEILTRRVEALSLLYDEFARSEEGRRGRLVDLGAYIGRIAATVHGLDGPDRIALNVEAEALDAPVDQAGVAGLLVSELLTNAMRHAFGPGDTGRIDVTLAREGEMVRLAVRDDGRGMAPGTWPRHDSLGGRIALHLIEMLEARLEQPQRTDGTELVVRFPLRGVAT